jgi:hypothetical protein
MALINHSKKEINAKIIYFGPAGCGKNTALKYIYSRIKPTLRGEIKHIPAGGDNLLFFDFSPFDAPLSDGYHVRLHVYTLTGPVVNPATWKMTLKGADGIVVMVDASSDRLSIAQESVSQLRDYLSAYGVGLQETPAILLLNDPADNVRSIDDSEFPSKLDLPGITTCSARSASGEGVIESVTRLSRLVVDRLAGIENRVQAADHSAVIDRSEKSESSSEIYANSVQTPDVAELQTGLADSPLISVLSCDVSVEGSVVRIPLEISFKESSRRVVISVSIEPE